MSAPIFERIRNCDISHMNVHKLNVSSSTQNMTLPIDKIPNYIERLIERSVKPVEQDIPGFIEKTKPFFDLVSKPDLFKDNKERFLFTAAFTKSTETLRYVVFKFAPSDGTKCKVTNLNNSTKSPNTNFASDWIYTAMFDGKKHTESEDSQSFSDDIIQMLAFAFTNGFQSI